MIIHADKPHLWKADIGQSIDMYNRWFVEFAPKTFRETRLQTIEAVMESFSITANLTQIDPSLLRQSPKIISTLRMCCCPPLAVDRLIGLAEVSPHLIKTMENDGKLPPKLDGDSLNLEITKITKIFEQMLDPDIFGWRYSKEEPTFQEIDRAATIIADRLCGSIANPIVRNAQEKRQLDALKQWLEQNQYDQLSPNSSLETMNSGTFTFRKSLPIQLDLHKSIHITVDAIIMPKKAKKGELPLLLEAKSAGDFTNVNKRRKEETAKMTQLSRHYGDKLRFILFLCGYFDAGYLGYISAEGMDWIWEHRINDLTLLGL